MKKIISSLLVVSLISACATQAPQRSAESKSAIANVKNVEIFYTDNEKYTVVDLGGSGATGFGGMFGLVGALVSVAVDAASKSGVADRAEQRTNQFNTATIAAGAPANLSAEVATQVAQALAASGKTVKTTAIKRPTGSSVLANSDLSALTVTPSYNPLVLRTTYGYSAESATASYKPVVNIEYALLDNAKKPLLSNTVRDTKGETYLTFDGLTTNAGPAGNVIKNNALQSAKTLVSEVMDASK